MAVKSKSKAKTTEFEKLVASYAERVNNGELTPLKAVQYREFGDDKGYFIVVDEEQDLTGTIWVNDSTVPDKFRTYAYHSRKSGNRPEERDDELTELLSRTCSIFVAWGFWLVFHYLRNEYGLQDNHKRAYRLWKQTDLLMLTFIVSSYIYGPRQSALRSGANIRSC